MSKSSIKPAAQRDAPWACRDRHVRLLILDNFENVSDSRVRGRFAELIKVLAGQGPEYDGLKLVVIGIATTAQDLLVDDDSVIRRTAQVPVPHMPADELREILRKGRIILDLEFDSNAEDMIVYASDGFPFFTHLLGLHSSRRAREKRARVITQETVRQAVADAVGDVKATLRNQVTRALERGGDVRPRTKILEVMADIPYEEAGEWTSAQIIAAYQEKFGRVRSQSFLHVALAQLADEEGGKVLLRTGKPKSYIYRFRSPFTRPYLRMRALRD